MVIGWRGGVGRALMGLLAKHPVGQALAAKYSGLDLIDATDDGYLVDPRPHHGTPWPPREIRCIDDLIELIDRHPVRTVIEVANVGTLDCARECAKRGIQYLSTSLENWPALTDADHGDDFNRAIIDAQQLLPGRRPDWGPTSCLIGAGMNPGLVNALVPAAIERFAQHVGAPASTEGLDLYGIYVTEIDTTIGTVPPDVFACTWSPRSCLEELFEPTAMYVLNDTPVELPHSPHAVKYRFRCGRDEIDANIVPHDEILTIGHRYPTVELAFAYQLPPAAAAYLEAHGTEDPVKFPSARLCPPYVDDLRGSDRVGVLLASRTHGEYWFGFDNDCDGARPFGTNATELQVAAGVIAAWEQLGEHPGIHTVDDLDNPRLLKQAFQILGEPSIHHAPAAAGRQLGDRRVP